MGQSIAQQMAAILTALRQLSVDGPVTAEAIGERVVLPVKTVRHHLVSMERLGLVYRERLEGSRREGWRLTDFQMP